MQWNTKESLLEAIRNGEGPVLPQKKTPLLREDLPDIDFWVGKPIASGRPSRKHYLNEKAKLTAPVTSWIAGVNEDVAFENEFEDEVAIVRSPRGREGSDAIKKILGYKAFEFPKPPSLIKHLLEQCTGSDDLILDFYAGSGTTGHATLLLNKEQNANRRFILVSATEASGKEPEKNICRDVCAVRMKRVIEGGSNLPALGGTMAYMRSIRTPMEDLYDDIRHDQIWYTLQQIHFDGICAYQEGGEIQVLESEDLRLAYLSETTSTTLATLQEFLDNNHKQTVVYSWQPGVVEQHCLHEHLQIERIPEYLTDRFGGGLV